MPSYSTGGPACLLVAAIHSTLTIFRIQSIVWPRIKHFRLQPQSDRIGRKSATNTKDGHHFVAIDQFLGRGLRFEGVGRALDGRLMTLNVCLLVASVGFMACVLAIPCATRVAKRFGAIDKPDNFRRIHRCAIPRMGGLGVALGLLCAIGVGCLTGRLDSWAGSDAGMAKLGYLAIAGLVIFALGAVDDCRGLNPKTKLLGQALAVAILFAGGFRIERVEFLGAVIPLSFPYTLTVPGLELSLSFDLPCFVMTLLWLVACMNIWNLIDGMDGLASGVGLLASGTFVLIAAHSGNVGAAVVGAALSGSLAGFLLYNWHPACIFLGDSGALLMGLILGVLGLDLTQREASAVPILLPIVAMGLPITDTAMAIFRRWVRDLPLSAADRRHVHHLLIGLGLTTRQAVIVLYVFSAGLCGIVLLGVAYRNDGITLALGIAGCASFLLVLTSRRDELARLISDYQERRKRRRQEREMTKLTWEVVQRIELSETAQQVGNILMQTFDQVGGCGARVRCRVSGSGEIWESRPMALSPPMTDTPTRFRLREGSDLDVEVGIPSTDAKVEPDIALRIVQRVALSAGQRLTRLGCQPQTEGLSDPEGTFSSGLTTRPPQRNGMAGNPEPNRVMALP